MLDDIIDAPANIFLANIKNDEIPVHLILCLVDEFKYVLFVSCLEKYLLKKFRGLTTEMKQLQIDLVRKTLHGSIQDLGKGGHMVGIYRSSPVMGG